MICNKTLQDFGDAHWRVENTSSGACTEQPVTPLQWKNLSSLLAGRLARSSSVLV